MKKRIFLIEDDADARLLFTHMLGNAGYEVEDFSSGDRFMNTTGILPDLFILDNAMPNIDGIALTKYLKVKEHTRDIPVLIMSGNPSIGPKALRAGAAAFVAKPFEVNDFLTTVHDLLSVDIKAHKESRIYFK